MWKLAELVVERFLCIAGDTIVGLNATRVSTPGDLLSALDELSIGDKAQLKIRRGSEELVLDIKLQEELS